MSRNHIAIEMSGTKPSGVTGRPPRTVADVFVATAATARLIGQLADIGGRVA